MIALGPWQALLDAIGWVLARIYDVVPNYGLSIIILTVVIKLLLLPLGIKQIKSMQHMQAIQPKLKELQKKYKGNKQKIQEEQMRLYKEAGVNPLGGCLPLLLQFPILIAMYSVIKPVTLEPVTEGPDAGAYSVVSNHLPEDSSLFHVILVHGDTDFLWMNLQCSLKQSGSEAELTVKDPSTGETVPIVPGKPIIGEDGEPIPDAESVAVLDCGSSRVPDSIPYVLLLLLMVGSTFFQQIQMQKASPPGSQSQQQQAIMRVMPLMFAFFGLTFPAGLVLYWTTSNIFQIGQQWALLRAGHIGPDALEKRMQEQRERAATRSGEPEKESFMQRMLSKAEDAQQQRDRAKKPPGGAAGNPGAKKPPPGKKPSGGKGSAPGNQLKRKPKEEGPS